MDRKTEFGNVPSSIESKIGRNLHLMENHPVNIVTNKIFSYFDSLEGRQFAKFTDLSPVVTIKNNFDYLLVPDDHPARSKSDTYYVNENEVLRTHTSAHQNDLLAKGYTSFLVAGDVYRKDEIDSCHYPVFHQMEGVHIVEEDVDPKKDLIEVLSGMVSTLFPGCDYRIRDHHFPFTDPSFEFDVKYRGEWLEILGCGVVHKDILERNDVKGTGWAWGIGLDRIAMRLFDIPDIRYLWSEHPRFLDQFKSGEITTFTPFSELPSQTNDVSFWLNPEHVVDDDSTKAGWRWIRENDFFDLVRDVGGDIIERVTCIDQYFNKKTNRHSCAYRFSFQPLDPEVKNPAEFTAAVLKLYWDLVKAIDTTLPVEVRDKPQTKSAVA